MSKTLATLVATAALMGLGAAHASTTAAKTTQTPAATVTQPAPAALKKPLKKVTYKAEKQHHKAHKVMVKKDAPKA